MLTTFLVANLLLISGDVSVRPDGATVIVATADSSEQSKATAQFTGDGRGDESEINAAIRSLPPVGGTVFLMEGTYDIRKTEGTLGGVLIGRSNVVLAGQGAATKLVLAPDQNTNVIRIIGSDVGHVTIRDLYVDANRDQNGAGKGDPNISHDRFEFCGIKAYYQAPGGPGGAPNHDIMIERVHVRDAHRLGIMLEGWNVKVINSFLGNAGSDAVEILTGPGEIRGNYVEITGQTHVAVGSDRADSMIMSNNIVHVRRGGDLDIGFRSWAGSKRHIIANNVLTVDPEGKCRQAIDARGTHSTIMGNCIQNGSLQERLRVTIGGGHTTVTGNVFENVILEINDRTDSKGAIIVEHNILDRSGIEHKRGNLSTDVASEESKPAGS
ncbi:MAG: hypothetical protein HY706_17020 [Candidatus Hydrogenedentes bacterium]|nr:hypothetical protein [Candidatus Hydrogenedentota bacterium]